MLDIRDLRCGYASGDVVHGVTFTLKRNETLCLLGPNGCGKTTLLRAIAGILPSRGDILMDGLPLLAQKREEIARRIALFSQMTALYFPFSVYETVMMGRYPHMKKGLMSQPSKADRDIVENCLEKVAMIDEKDKSAMSLSGGQLQRVMLARIFAQSPRVILLDEPTNHLDVRHQAELLEHIREWVAEGERAALGVFHDITIGLRVCDRVLLMSDGVIKASGAPAIIAGSQDMNGVYGLDVASFMREGFSVWK